MAGKKKADPDAETHLPASLRQRAEELVQSGKVQRLIDEEVANLSLRELSQVVHELRVHQEELTLQNEELRRAQEELSASRDRFQDLYDSAPVGYLTLDHDGRVLEANSTIALLLSTGRSNLIGSRLTEFITPESQDVFFLHRHAVLERPGKHSCELLLRNAGGPHVHARLESVPVRALPGEETSGLRTALIDITGEKQAEEWRILARRLERMVEELPAAAVFLTGDDLHLNRAAKALTGYERGELETKADWFAGLYGEGALAARAQYEALRESGFQDRSEPTSIWRKDGEERRVEFAYHRFDGHEVWLLFDLTERIHAEEDHARLASLVRSSPVAILELSLDGTVQHWNPAAEALFGYNAREAIGQRVDMLLPPERRGEFDAIVEDLVGGGAVIELETERKHKDGTTIEVALTASLIRGSGGEPTGMTSIVQDIRERKRLERDVAGVAEAEQQRIARELHDGLGSMLTAIDWRLTGFGRALQGSGMKEEGVEALAISREIRDAISQVRAVTQGLQPLGDDPADLIYALRGLAEQVRASGLTRCRLLVPDPESCTLTIPGSGTANQLSLIAREAVHNALRHSGATHVTIHLKEDGGRLALSVSDNGCGFDPGNLAARRQGEETRGTGPNRGRGKGDASKRGGIGIGTMEYRARMIGARLRFLSRRKGGTRVVCEL